MLQLKIWGPHGPLLSKVGGPMGPHRPQRSVNARQICALFFFREKKHFALVLENSDHFLNKIRIFFIKKYYFLM